MRKTAYFRSAEAKTKLPYDARRVLEEEGFKKYPILTLLFINSALYENNVQFAEAYCVYNSAFVGVDNDKYSTFPNSHSPHVDCGTEIEHF